MNEVKRRPRSYDKIRCEIKAVVEAPIEIKRGAQSPNAFHRVCQLTRELDGMNWFVFAQMKCEKWSIRRIRTSDDFL